MRVHKYSLIERLLYPYVRRIIAAYDDAQRLTWKQCPSCKTPLMEGTANFCYICGVSLVPPLPASAPVEPAPVQVAHPTIPLTPPEQTIVTDALYKLNQRPIQNFIQAQKNGAGIHTAMSVAIDVEKLRKQAKGKI